MNYQLGYVCLADNMEKPRKVYFKEENKFMDQSSVKEIAVCEKKTVCVNETGDIYTWGIDYDGKNFRALPEHISFDPSPHIDIREISLTQSEFDSLSKTGKNVTQYFYKSGADLDFSRKFAINHKKSGNMFEMTPDYFLAKFCVNKICCSNKHTLLVFLGKSRENSRLIRDMFFLGDLMNFSNLDMKFLS